MDNILSWEIDYNTGIEATCFFNSSPAPRIEQLASSLPPKIGQASSQTDSRNAYMAGATPPLLIFRKNPDKQDEADELIRAWTESFIPMSTRALEGWNDPSGNPFYEEFSAITHQDDADLHDHKDADLHEHCLMLPILNVCAKLALNYFYRVDTARQRVFWDRKAPHWEQTRKEQSEATNNAPNELCRLKVIVFCYWLEACKR